MIQIVLCLEIVAFTALVMSAIFLAVAYIPHERKVLNVKRSKNLVQLASVLLGSSGIVLVAQNYQLRDITFYVQVMAHIESAILILAMILLLTKNFNTQKFVFTQSIWIAACILILYGYYYVYKGSIQNGWYYLLNCIYIIQFFFYFFTYKHLFETWRNKKYQYGKYGSTIKFLWLLLNLMATFVMSMLFFPSRTLFSVLIVFYIITFITFTILFYRLLIILNIADFEREYQYNMKGRDKASTQKNMESALQGWIENKGFVERNITITTLAKQLGTNRTYLSNHINENFGENFNTWVNQLRIKEAQVLLEESNRSLHEIADSVGFTDLPHFSRTFKSVTGQSPSAWRKQSGKSE